MVSSHEMAPRPSAASGLRRGRVRVERVLAWVAAVGVLLPLIVMPATVLIYQPLFRQAFTDTPDVHEKLAHIDQIMYAGLYVSLAASLFALLSGLVAIAGRGQIEGLRLPLRVKVFSVALPLAALELLALLVWIAVFQASVNWRWG